MTSSEEIAFAYHEATKHHFHRSARSLGYLDWANQADPFRRYDGAPLIPLPLHTEDTTPPYEWLYRPGAVAVQPVSLASIGLLFECSLAISAWKEYRGERWALRCNPSSGNLHPTEGYLVAGAIDGLSDAPGVYHYAPKEHCLERRLTFGASDWEALVAPFSASTFLVGLTSIHWREAWKYGERAYRYCQHDAGHALATVRLAAAMLGWRVTLLEGMSDVAIATLLGIDRDDGYHDLEREAPDLLMAIGPHETTGSRPTALSTAAVTRIASGSWQGRANCLSDDHVDWSIIREVERACEKPETESSIPMGTNLGGTGADALCGLSALRIIQQRRSAVEMDGKTGISREVFYGMLRRVVPSLCAVPWDAASSAAHVHLGLFVHRVDGIAPGLYALVRNASAFERVRAAMKREFAWEQPEACPDELPLYRLATGDCRQAATAVSCGQDIAGDGAFSLGMITEFGPVIRRQGPWMYRR